MSVLVAESDEAWEETLHFDPSLHPERHGCYRNHVGATLGHLDRNDLGYNSKLLAGTEQLHAAGGRVVRGSEVRDEQGRLKPEEETEHRPLRQMVMIFSKGLAEAESLAVFGMDKGDFTACLQAPAQTNDAIRVYLYSCDYSALYHGNPCSASFKMPPGSWAVRVTPYGTVHSATWANRVLQMEPPRAEAFLNSIVGAPGHSMPDTSLHPSVPGADADAPSSSSTSPSCKRRRLTRSGASLTAEQSRPEEEGMVLSSEMATEVTAAVVAAEEEGQSEEARANELARRKLAGLAEASAGEWEEFEDGNGTTCIVCGGDEESPQPQYTLFLCRHSHHQWRHGIHYQCVRDGTADTFAAHLPDKARRGRGGKAASDEADDDVLLTCPMCRPEQRGEWAFSVNGYDGLIRRDNGTLVGEASPLCAQNAPAAARRHQQWLAASRSFTSAQDAKDRCIQGATVLLRHYNGHLERRCVAGLDAYFEPGFPTIPYASLGPYSQAAAEQALRASKGGLGEPRPQRHQGHTSGGRHILYKPSPSGEWREVRLVTGALE